MFLTKTFNYFPTHTQVIIDFKFVILKAWNGELFEVLVDNISKFKKNFSSSKDLSNLCDGMTRNFYPETIESINIQLNHSGSSLTIKMQGFLTSSISNAAWGIKDFKVYIVNNCKGGCLACTLNNETNCLMCPIFSKLDSTGKCICEEHFFMKTNDFVHCAICHHSCKSCDGPLETNCLTCFIDHVKLEGKCEPNINNSSFFYIF